MPHALFGKDGDTFIGNFQQELLAGLKIILHGDHVNHESGSQILALCIRAFRGRFHQKFSALTLPAPTQHREYLSGDFTRLSIFQ